MVQYEKQFLSLSFRWYLYTFTSFDFMSMLGEIEDEMDVEIEQDKAADIRTVGEAVAYLESLK